MTLLCLVEGLRNVGGGFVGKGSGDEDGAYVDEGTVESVLSMRGGKERGSWKGKSESGGFASSPIIWDAGWGKTFLFAEPL